MPSIAQSLAPHIGIESILQADELDNARLPEQAGLNPSEEQIELQLRTVLLAPTSEEWLLTSLKPQLSSNEVLQPEKFHELLNNLHDRLGEEAGKATEPAVAEKFQAAAKLLEDQQQLTELLLDYRHALHRA